MYSLITTPNQNRMIRIVWMQKHNNGLCIPKFENVHNEFVTDSIICCIDYRHRPEPSIPGILRWRRARSLPDGRNEWNGWNGRDGRDGRDGGRRLSKRRKLQLPVRLNGACHGSWKKEWKCFLWNHQPSHCVHNKPFLTFSLGKLCRSYYCFVLTVHHHTSNKKNRKRKPTKKNRWSCYIHV